mmetsp:Transcript_112425/g.324787  ORF Transcript_112425/g.324787 Transcript_112425/m.324787 type:complete len:98 (+) Transcript_112425:823-1116(+)
MRTSCRAWWIQRRARRRPIERLTPELEAVLPWQRVRSDTARAASPTVLRDPLRGGSDMKLWRMSANPKWFRRCRALYFRFEALAGARRVAVLAQESL